MPTKVALLRAAVDERFAAMPYLTTQILSPARVTMTGSKVSGAKAMSIYHLDDGEMGTDAKMTRPLATALTKAVDELGFRGRTRNAALYASRHEDQVRVLVAICSLGDVLRGQGERKSVQTDREFMRGDDDRQYLVPRVVGTMVDIAPDGTYVTKEALAEMQHYHAAPLPWDDYGIEDYVRTQIREGIVFNLPTLPMIRQIGIPA